MKNDYEIYKLNAILLENGKIIPKENRPNFGGIYCIINKLNNKYYLGSAVNIYNRWRGHISELKKNRHHSKHLQNAWNKYTHENFDFKVIEKINCPKNLDKNQYEEYLRDIEQEYLEIFNPYNSNTGYNCCEIAGPGPDLSYTYEDLKNGKCPFIEEQFYYIIEQLKNPYVFLIDLSKELNLPIFIIKAIYESRYKVLTKDLVFPKRIRSRVRAKKDTIIEMFNNGDSYNKIANKIDSDARYIVEVLKKEGVENRNHNRKKVYQFSLIGELINIFDSTSKAAEYCECIDSIIQKACKDEDYIYNNSLWSYSDKIRSKNKFEEILGEYIRKTDYPIIQYDLNKIPLKLYKNCKEIKIDSKRKGNQIAITSRIKNVCNINKTELKTLGYGFYWKYAKDASELDLDYLLQQKLNQNNNSKDLNTEA